MKKRIYFISVVPLKELPPAISLIMATKDLGYDIHWVSLYSESNYKKLFDDLHVCGHFFTSEEAWGKKSSNKFVRHYLLSKGFNKFVMGILEGLNEDDLIWIVHEDTAARLSKKILAYSYYFSIYELRKTIKNLKFIPSNVLAIAQHAKVTIVPEYNRAHILATWWGLPQIPKVLPNKPYLVNETQETNDIRQIVEQLHRDLEGSSMVLYQGVFADDRNLEFFIDGILSTNLPLKPVLMGRENDYLHKLKKKYGKKIIHIPALPAPQHLEITKYAHIGIVSYQIAKSVYDPLNIVYCAPNKIFEYSKYSVPMVCSDLPGLRYTVQENVAGICVNSNNEEELRLALCEIENNYALYQEGAKKLYASVDVKKIVGELLEDN